MQNSITFSAYINKYHDWFKVDPACEPIVKAIEMYAHCLPDFELFDNNKVTIDGYRKMYQEKGTLLIGNVGTGKTTLLRLLQKYYMYTKPRGSIHPEFFRIANIPEIADEFSMNGRTAFNAIKSGHWLLDELCFINELTGRPDREVAINFGDKILLGEKIIYDRYNLFVETGMRTHFTTNASVKQLREIYGERVFSRLVEMCNIFMYVGEDRRRTGGRPHFNKHYNTKVVDENIQLINPHHPQSEADKEKKHIQEMYEAYIRRSDANLLYDTDYDSLRFLGIDMPPLEPFIVKLKAEYKGAPDHSVEKAAKKCSIAAYFDDAIKRGESVLKYTK